MAALSLLRKTRLELSCRPFAEVFPQSGPIPIRVEISNSSRREVELLTVGIPWLSPNAIELRVLDGEDFRPALREGLPRTLPNVRIPPGGSIAGEIDLAHELLGPGDASVAELPGEYRLVAKVRVFVVRDRGKDERVELESEPFTIRVEERADAG